MVLTAYILITSKLTLLALSPQTSSSCSLWLRRHTHGYSADTLQFSLLLSFSICVTTMQQFSLISNLGIILDSSKTFRPLAIQAPSLDSSFSHLFLPCSGSHISLLQTTAIFSYLVSMPSDFPTSN